MANIFHVLGLSFTDKENSPPEFNIQTVMPRLFQVAGAKNLMFDIRKLQPGTFSFPYHFHRSSEELMYVISGSMMLRSPEGLKEVSEGDLLYFETGETGAHQFYNHGNEPCVYLDVRTSIGIDVAEYPDSGKVNILPDFEVYKKDGKADYYDGEENVKEIWGKLGG